MRGSLLKVRAPEGRAGSDVGSTAHSSPDSTASHTERRTVPTSGSNCPATLGPITPSTPSAVGAPPAGGASPSDQIIKEESPSFRLGAVSMAARLYLRSGHPSDRALLVKLVNAEILYLAEIPE